MVGAVGGAMAGWGGAAGVWGGRFEGVEGGGGLRTDSNFYGGMASAPQQGQFLRGHVGGTH